MPAFFCRHAVCLPVSCFSPVFSLVFFCFIRFVSLDSSLFSSLCVARPVSFLFVCLPVYLPFGPSASLTGLSLRLSRSLSLPLSVSPSRFLSSVNFSPFLSRGNKTIIVCFVAFLSLSLVPPSTLPPSLSSRANKTIITFYSCPCLAIR